MYSLLIVDDMPLTAASLAEDIAWDTVGITDVFTAYDYHEAMQIMNSRHVHILLTDIRMPGKSGLDLIQSLFEKWPGLRIIIYSAYDEFTYAQQAIQYGVDAFLTKPTAYPDILEQVKRSIGKIKSAQEPAEKPVPASAAPQPVPSQNFLVRHAQEYIGEHLTEPISLQNIADYLHVHPNYLSRVFKAAEGVTVFDYIIEQKINYAIQLLKQPGTRVSDIPEMIGYESVSYFSRVFKKQTGYSPKEYIQRYL